MRKKGLLIFGLIFLSIFLSSVIISAEACNIRPACFTQKVPPEYPVMKLSGTTNAHGGLLSDTGLTYYLCCDFGDGVQANECTGANKILGLYSATNSHAQVPSMTDYTSHVCYEDFSCTSTTSSSCPSSFPIQMVSLSSVSNAHIGGFNDYANKICCKTDPDAECGNGIVETANNEECDDGNVNDYTAEGYLDGCSSTCEVMPGWDCTGSPSICANAETYWVKDGQSITETTLQEGENIETFVLNTFGLNYGSSITFTIYEIDRFAWVRYNTREIGTFSGTVIGGGSIAYVVIDNNFLTELQSDSEASYELIFEVGGMESRVLKVTEILEPVCTDTCASLNYECGTYDICGVSTNCGTCASGNVCNSAGQCIPETPACQITSASWSVTSAVENNSVNLNVGVSNCDGQNVAFVVKENDGTGDDDVVINPDSKIVSTGATSVTTTWTAEYQDDRDGVLQTNPPEYYFTASIGSLSLKSSNELIVSEYDEAECLGVGFCADYTETQCNSDPCNVAQNSVGAEEITCGFGYDCSCEYVGSSCVGAWSEWANCGNGIINTGEQCDGSEWGPITNCTDFGYTGGTLSCDGCVFDTSQCTGRPAGICGDGVLNTGEQCDTYTLPFTNCTRFDDFTGGNLFCNDYCILNTISCEGGTDGTETSSGKCVYTENSDDDCEDGILERDLTATWIGEDAKPASCENVKDTLVCPAQIKVSFFGGLQLAIAVLIVIIIYIILKSKMKKPIRKSVKTPKKKKSLKKIK